MSKDNVVEKFHHAGRTVSILHDDDPTNPREDGNLATLACWHARNRLGDEQISGGMNEEEIREHVGEEIVALLPLFIYEHGGITMSTGPFGCRFDSGQVGWAYVTKASAEKMGCVGVRYDYVDGKPNPVGAWDQAAWEDAIRGEVKSYDDFLTGQCYGYRIEGLDGAELDSSWGFIGDLDGARSCAKSAAEHSTDPVVERKVEEMAERATYAAGV